MFKITHAALALGLLLAPALPAAAQDASGTQTGKASADTVLATVNGEPITLGQVIATRQALPDQYQALPDDVLLKGIVEQLVQQAVLAQAAGELEKRAQIMLENERRALAAGQKISQISVEAVTEQAIKTAYEEKYVNAAPETEYNASHILVKTEEEAADLIRKLNEGADFATLAREFSTGPSGPNGGELGWFTQGMMVKPFEEVVMNMKVGEIAGPIQTQFGWHVIKLNDKRAKDVPPLDAVRDELASQIENDALERALQTLLENAKIERTDLTTLDPSLLRRDDLLDQTK